MNWSAESRGPRIKVDAIHLRVKQLNSKIVPVNKAVALAAFEVICQTPQPLPLMDAIIAATAGSQGASLVHRDEHMRPIPRRCLRQCDLNSAKR